MPIWRAIVLFALIGTALVSTHQLANQQPADMVGAAKTLMGAVSKDGLAKLHQPIATEKRVVWHFIPMDTRNGLPMMEMEPSQRMLAMKLLETVLSQVGYDKAKTVMSLENVLRMLEGPGSEQKRNPEKYYFEIFGDVGADSRWGLSVEGHHLSVNFTMMGNKIVDSTPQFFASNPAELKTDYGTAFPKGLRILRDEEELAFGFVKSLNSQQKKLALLDGETPKEIRAAGTPQPPASENVGVTADKLSADQQASLRNLMKSYTEKMRAEVAAERWQLIEQAGFDKIAFCWSGGEKAGEPHYYRVQGPTFLIEFINVQPDSAGNPANHIHSVWRDMLGDFDLPILAQ